MLRHWEVSHFQREETVSKISFIFFSYSKEYVNNVVTLILGTIFTLQIFLRKQYYYKFLK